MRHRLYSLIMIAALAPMTFAQSGTKTWYQVLEVKGTASKQTDLFTIKGTKWRIKWQKPASDNSLRVTIYDKEGTPIDMILTKDSTNDESYIHKAGTYYLSISASNGYIITVEDWR